MTPLRLGTRGSRLAMAQSRQVAELLQRAHPGLSVALVELRTSGDRIQDVPLGPDLGRSFFTKEIEDALLDERIDLAVHSCKDLATALPDGLALGAIPAREDPRDALVASGGARLAELPTGARVGTSSPRRRSFLAAARPDVSVVDLRGNVPTRVRSVDDGRIDAAILAVAGLRRLGMSDRISDVLDPELMLPAAAQGALAIQVRGEDLETLRLVEALDDPRARAEVTAERACLHRLAAGCQAPVGVLARIAEDGLTVRVAVATPTDVVRAEVSGAAGSAERAGVAAAETILERIGTTSLRATPSSDDPPSSAPAR